MGKMTIGKVSHGVAGGALSRSKGKGGDAGSVFGPARSTKSSIVVGQPTDRGTGIKGGPEVQYNRGINTSKAFPMSDRAVAHRNTTRGR
jgi:hypothetical protein